jgi:hypothetical protein
MVGINIESMTEEQMVEMAIRESTAAPQIPAYEPLNNDSINTFLSDGMVYTTNPSQSRGLPNMGEYEMPQRTTPNTRPEVFPSAPTINVPREESQFNAELPDVNFQAHGPSRLRNLAGMTEEEMLEMAIAESMRTY